MNEEILCGTWVRPPFEGLSHPGWGLVLCFLLLLTALGATWKVLAPGGVTPGERRAHHPRFRRAARCFGILLLAAPWLMTAGAALFVVPLRPPRTAVLVSRSRTPPPPGRASEDPWAVKRPDLARAILDAPRPFDAGLLVDKALDKLRSAPAFAWEIEAPETSRRVATAVREVLEEEDLPPLDPRHPSSREPRGDLPRWLVESTEISLLQGLTRRYNIEEVHALVAKRKTAAGFAWDGVAALLSGRAECPRVDPESLIQVEDQPLFTLQSAVRAWRSSEGCTGVEIEIGLVTAASPEPPQPLHLALFSQGRQVGGEYRSQVSLSREEQWVRKPACFPLAGAELPEAGTSLEIRSLEGTAQVLPVRDPRRHRHEATAPAVLVRVPVDTVRSWERTREALLGDDPVIRHWQERMRSLGFDLAALQGGNYLDLSVRDCDAEERAFSEVVLDACRKDEDAGGVWIYPASFLEEIDAQKADPLAELRPDARSVLRGHVPPRGLPGTDSWDGIPLVQEETFFRPREVGFLPHADVHALSGSLLDGSSPRDNLAWPLVTRAELPDGERGLARVTHLGFDPVGQGLLLDPSGSPGPHFDPDRFFAGWTQIVEALYMAGTDAPPWRPEDASAALIHPRTFLSGRDLARIAGRGLVWPLTAAILGVLLYALVVMLGLRTLPRRPRSS